MYNRNDYTEQERRIAGAMWGAAIGDAMGGPVECQHAARIKKHYGTIDTLLPYRKPPGLLDLRPGYALHDAPGSVTDDTFIRLDFCHYFEANPPPYKAGHLAGWLLANAELSYWWPPALQALQNVADGKFTAEENGLHHPQGGGNGWWTPIGLLWSGKPDTSAAICMELSSIWKSSLEQQLNASIQAGLAYAVTERAHAEGIVETMLEVCGPLARKLLERAAEVGGKASSLGQLIDEIYGNLLVNQELRDPEGPLPPVLKPVDYSDEAYTSIMLAEQVAIEVAVLLFSKGEPNSIANTVMVGRDCDSTATTVGSWVGALHGIDAFPVDWIDAIQKANRNEFNMQDEVDRLIQTYRRFRPAT